ncbi:hypothetical protein ST201phi2-1p366 [Pseudomonas phage 201phi2-1]|uniref:Uncharacterized protein n=1 Tax=Pseudomonas phage 201phi2-1 TaxID=198110 RepID=B3FJM6_BP201|nr:hypothetical protein ST201phi2-1p366 [Pseudomonas phage 201phi2-1]ABY63191.1 hypothetical protein 201phi2-1p366 [Pseudomonas phage 201phi2-1]
MTDQDLFEEILRIISHPNVDASSFKGHPHETAVFAMGAFSADPYYDGSSPIKSWSRVLQLGRLMQLFYDAPAPVSIAMALCTIERSKYWPGDSHNNVLEGFKHVMSDYAYRIVVNAMSGIESNTTRTYHMLNHILQLGLLYRVLSSGNQSVDLESVQYSLGRANIGLQSSVAESDDAHPMARAMLERIIEEVQRLIQPKVRSDAA